MTIEENKAGVRQGFAEVLNTGDLTLLDEGLAPTFVRHDLGGRPDILGPEGAKAFVRALRSAFPDIEVTIDDMVAEGDKVVVRYTARGTHLGDLLGIAATGKKAAWAGINIYDGRDGKIVETWQLMDTLGLMRQLGVISPPGSVQDHAT